MLVLSRKVRERIRIADDIILEIVEIKENRVRIAISAPRDVPIHREEIYNAIKNEEGK